MGRRGRDERPAVDPWEASEAPPETTQVEPGAGRRRWRSGALLAVVALALGVLLALDGSGGGRDDERAGDGADEDAAADRTTTTRRLTTTSTTVSILPPGPVLGRPVGATLVFAEPEQERWTYLDLDTGAMGELEVGPAEPSAVVPVRRGVVVPEPSQLRFVRLIGEPVPIFGADAEALPSSTPDAVWVTSSGTRAASAVLVDLAGRVLQGPLELGHPLVHGSDNGVAYERGGQIYLTDSSGTRAVATGSVRSRSGPWLVAESCDDVGRCVVERTDLLSGERADYGPSAGDGSLWWVVPSPDGSLAVLVTAPDFAQPQLSLVEVGGEVRWDGQEVSIAADDVAWLPDGSGFVALDRVQARAVIVTVPGDNVVVIERLPMLSTPLLGRILVVPH